MQDLFRHLPAVIYEYAIHPDGKKRFNYVSPNCPSILGLECDEILEDYKKLHTIIHEDDLHSFRETVQESREHGVEWHWKGKVRVNDLVKWLEFRSNHMQLEDGTI